MISFALNNVCIEYCGPHCAQLIDGTDGMVRYATAKVNKLLIDVFWFDYAKDINNNKTNIPKILTINNIIW